MKTVKVKTDELLGIVKSNRDAHRDMFEKAMAGYRKQAIAELDRAITDAKAGRKITRYLSLVEPIDQTKDYDRVIEMLRMSVDEEVELTSTEFAQYVQDDWSWKDQFLATNISYIQD
jgi:hypothetical protein